MIGESDPLLSNPGSIRGDFTIDLAKTSVHASDSLDNA